MNQLTHLPAPSPSDPVGGPPAAPAAPAATIPAEAAPTPIEGGATPGTGRPSGPARPARRRTPTPSAADRAFLPAALELLETPPSPIRIRLMVTICVLVVVSLIWGWFGQIEIVATATGRIQPTGRVKVVQPVEAGRVDAVLVSNGAEVAAGDALIRLDPRDAQADVSSLSATLSSLVAEAQRRRAVLGQIAADRYDLPTVEWAADVPPTIREREGLVMQADLASLSADLAGLDASRIQKQADVMRLEAMIVAQQDLLSTQDQRVVMRQKLVEMAVGSKAQLIDAQETRQVQRVTLARLVGEQTQARAELQVAATERKSTLDRFVADYGQKLADAERQIDDYRERLNKARARLERMTLTAPIDGTVTSLSVHGAGQVLAAGEDLMRIVPEGSRFELEVYMPNSDIGFIRLGQPVTVKVDSFPYSRYGGIEGKVTRIARDAISENDVRQQISSPASGASASSGKAEPVQNLVYPVTVELAHQTMVVDGEEVPLSAGMTAQAEIETGRRRILDYLISPMVDVGSRAMRER